MPQVGFEPTIPAGDWAQTYALGYDYIGARTDTTQQSRQTPDKEVEIKNITVYFSGYTETDKTGMLSPPTVWSFSVAADIVMFLTSTTLYGVCPDCCVVSCRFWLQCSRGLRRGHWDWLILATGVH